MSINVDKRSLLAEIDRDRAEIVGFLQQFIRAKSPNPPGDTRAAAAHVAAFLTAKGLDYRTIAPMANMPNLVATFDAGAPGKHLVLNGHMDVFPAGDASGWDHDPWAGALVDGKIFGRGASDMKAGTASLIFTYLYLHRMREKLRGRLTLTCVSDEETFGPWGSAYLMEHHPEVRGDCMLSGEPSGLNAVRFGEKGLLWLELTVRTRGAHGASVHLSASATKIAARLIEALEDVTQIVPRSPHNVMQALVRATPTIDEAMGKGASAILEKVTLNIGVVAGGLKVNLIPAECRIEADIRLPIGTEKDQVIAEVLRITSRVPEVTVEELNFSAPAWCDPHGELVSALQSNVKTLSGIDPVPIVSLGGTDARLWRYRGIPAYAYGPPPVSMAAPNEHVRVDDFLHVLRAHVLSAYDYLSGG